ncbi:uncharacterized protein JCM15063_000595 [Sporobolomyces koalae]|uniref:uncharacterized protein n=1 Tax=Sporobolomyces koalae TaxID=500713 RepID=UPI00317F7E02
MLSQQRPENKGRKTTTTDPPRRRSYSSKSCNNCRKRKAKCDGVQPICSTCALYKSECVWSEDVDKRRTARKGEVAALRERIKTLEALLDGRDPQATGGESTRYRTELIQSDEDEVEETDVADGVGINRLKIDEQTLELTAYGPTSAFQHLPEPPITSRLSASPRTNPLSPTPVPLLSSPVPSIDTKIHWNKYLPALVDWDERLHDKLVDLFFHYFNTWCFWIEEDQFRQDLRALLSCSSEDRTSTTSRSSHYSPLLHLVLLAIACAYSDDRRASRANSQLLVTAAKAHLDDEGERPTIATLRGLLLLGSWHSGNGLQGLGNIYSGMGFRMSQTLGLGIDSRAFVRSGVLSKALQRTRDYAMWTCYVQDKLWSSYVGRNPTLVLGVLETPAPYIDKELDSKLWKPLEGMSRRSPAVSHVTETFHWTTRLAIIQEKVLSTLYALRVNVKSSSVLNTVSELNLKLESWGSKLPARLRCTPQLTKAPPGHVILLNAAFHFVTILLYRPYYNHSDSLAINELAIKKCNAASSRIISLFELFEQAPGLRYPPVTFVQICFAAGTTQLLASVNSSGRKAQDAKDAALRCVAALREMGKAWKCGTQTAEILDRLVVEWAPSESNPPTSQPDAVETPVATDVQQSVDPELAATLLRLGWQPPQCQPDSEVLNAPSSSSLLTAQQAPANLPSPPLNPLSLQNGFASAFSQPGPHFPPYFAYGQHPPQQQYDPAAWLQAPDQQMPVLPDDVFAAMLSYSGREAMTGEPTEHGLNLNNGGPWYFG